MQWLTSVILVTQEAEIRKLVIQGQPQQKPCKTLNSTTTKLGMVEHICHPSNMGNVSRKISVQAAQV
jgi:hypothetical protein